MSELIEEEVESTEECNLQKASLEEARALLQSIALECSCENGWIRLIEAKRKEVGLFVPRGSRQLMKVDSDDVACRLKQSHIARIHELRERANAILCSSMYGPVLQGGNYDSIEAQVRKWLAVPEE